MKLLVTGVNGFVGQNLAPRLGEEGRWQVDGLVRDRGRAGFMLQRGADRLLEYGELGISGYGSGSGTELSQEEIGGWKGWIHLAGKAHDRQRVSGGEADRYFEVNTGLTRELFDRFAADPAAEMFIYVSSVKAVSERPEGEVHEEMPPHPMTPYGVSKLEAEKYIRGNCPPGKNCWILRPCLIHGPGAGGNLFALYRWVARGLPWPLGAFDNRRSFLSVDNFCFAIRKILEGELQPGTYHLADTRPISTNRLVRLMALAAGREPRIWEVRQGLVRGAARAGDLLRLPLDSERLRKLTENYVVSNNKLREGLGRDLPVETIEGLNRTLASFKRN